MSGPLDPGVEADPILAQPVAKQTATVRKSALPRVDRWLDASRKKGILRIGETMVRFHVANVWIDSTETASETLTVEVNVTNSPRSGSLDFRGWPSERDGISKDTVVLVDDKSDPLTLASTASRAGGLRRSTRRLGPNESATELLVFVKPGADYEHLRLALPYAAIGRTGHIGFEIPRAMVKDRPPDAEESGVIAEKPSAAEPPPSANVQEFAMPQGQSQGGQPETIDALHESIMGGMADDGQSALETNSEMSPFGTPIKSDKPTDGTGSAVEPDDSMGEGPRNE